MKKFLMFCVALFAMGMMFTSCSKCSSTELEQKEAEAVVVTTDNWEKIIAAVYPAINAQFPQYSFYEASALVKKIDDENWGVDHNTFRAAFGNPFANACVVCTIVNDTLQIQQYDEPWLEDIYTTPFVPTDLDLAIKTIQKTIDIDPTGLPAVLRHQLYPGETEPRWFIGTFNNCHTVNVYSMGVDVPLKDFNGLQIEHTGVAAQK